MGKTIELSEPAQEFLFYSCFGRSYSELKNCVKSGDCDNVIKICFRCAYFDFARTMSFKGKRAKDDFPDEMNKRKYEGTHLYSMIAGILVDGPKKFDTNHKKICKGILEIARRISYVGEKFYYGQAQKWLNMTLKYMYLTGLWEKNFSKIEESLHIPLDSYILKMVFFEENREKLKKDKLIDERIDGGFNYTNKEGDICFSTGKNGAVKRGSTLCTITKRKGRVYKPENSAYVTWSNIKYYDNYKKVQDEIRKCIPCDEAGKYLMSPLEWENKVWLVASELDRDNL